MRKKFIFFVLLPFLLIDVSSEKLFAQVPGGYLTHINSRDDLESFRSDGTYTYVIKTVIPGENHHCLDFVIYTRMGVGHHIPLMESLLPCFEGLSFTEFYERYFKTNEIYVGLIAINYDLKTEKLLLQFAAFENNLVNPMTLQEVSYAMRRLKETFNEGVLGELSYTPFGLTAIQRAHDWLNDTGIHLDFSIFFLPENNEDYIAYSQATNYGIVKIIPTLDDLNRAISQGQISWQHILVLGQTPYDIPQVVSGVITAEPQFEGGHIMIRSINRGTPNAYINDALFNKFFGQYDGKLIQLRVAEFGYEVVEKDINNPNDLSEAQQWWNSHRPNLRDAIREANFNYYSLETLQKAEPDITKYGGKASNLIKLYKFLPERYQVPGFVIPFHVYDLATQMGHLEDKLGVPGRFITTADYIQTMLGNERFNKNFELRQEILSYLREEGFRRSTITTDEILYDIRQKIIEVFGSDKVMVRFRSSSNAEDALEFNGAGLYDSKSVCAADSFDIEEQRTGPSICDPSRSDEEDIQEGLRDVFRSLWNLRAFEEREYSQIPHESTGMAILVTPAFPNEDVNGVAFTGNPYLKEDKRYFIFVQKGDTNVVNPEANIYPEKDILEISSEGKVANIVRAQHSSLLPKGYVLSDERLHEMGEVLYMIEQNFDIGYDVDDPKSVILDLEFKYDFPEGQGGRLLFKQIRPLKIAPIQWTTFLRGDANLDGLVDLSDAIRLLNFLFIKKIQLDCPDAGDVNDDGLLDISDPISLLKFLFVEGPSPSHPYPSQGPDRTADNLRCNR